MAETDLNPLTDDAPEEIPLAAAPLVRVVCQVRFTEIIKIAEKNFIADFQEAIRERYPGFQQEQSQNLEVQGGAINVSNETIWRFFDPGQNWRLSLSSGSIALETKHAYSSRADFIERIAFVMQQLEETIRPTHISRIGVRYIDQVQFEKMDDIRGMLREEMLGLKGSEFSGHIERFLNQLECRTREGKLLANWGILPANRTHDANMMPAVDKPSWFLDLDTFVLYDKSVKEFDSRHIERTAYDLAARAYAFFRWSVEDKFLATFRDEAK